MVSTLRHLTPKNDVEFCPFKITRGFSCDDIILFAQWTQTFYLQMSDVMEQNDVRSSKCIEGNGSHHLTNHESKLYSGSALSSLQISPQDQVSLKRDHTGNESTVKEYN